MNADARPAPDIVPAVAGELPLLEARGLGLRAGGDLLLSGLNWAVRAGERWCVIGRNAAGKSTLLRALAGLSVPRREGQVLWMGRDQCLWAPSDAAWVRAYAPQQSADRFPISVQRLLTLSVVRDGPWTPQQVLDALDAAPLAQRGVRQLSGGERQRVALAQCALQGAPLLLMDEPVSFQDPAHQASVGRWLEALAPAGGPRALVATAHDVNWIARSATHVLALVGQGRWLAGRTAEVLQAPHLERVYGCRWREVGGVWIAD